MNASADHRWEVRTEAFLAIKSESACQETHWAPTALEPFSFRRSLGREPHRPVSRVAFWWRKREGRLSSTSKPYTPFTGQEFGATLEPKLQFYRRFRPQICMLASFAMICQPPKRGEKKRGGGGNKYLKLSSRGVKLFLVVSSAFGTFLCQGCCAGCPKVPFVRRM